MMWSGTRSEVTEMHELSDLSEPGGVVLVLRCMENSVSECLGRAD